MAEKRFTDIWCSETGQIGITDNGIDRTFAGSEFNDFLNSLVDENKQLKEDIEYLDEKIKENEWHWNTIDEDRDVWAYKCKQAEKQVKELEEDLNDALNRIEERSIDVQLLKEENGNLKKENELKGDFRNFINEDTVRIKNENEQLKETIKELELENAKHIGDGEWDIRDITYSHGKFRLEEWGERYHQFYNGDKPLEDEEVVSLLFENEQLKSDNKEYIKGLDLAKATSQSWASDVRELREENCRLEKKNERLLKKIKRERASTTKQHLKWNDEAEEIINDLRRENEELKKENKQLKKVLSDVAKDHEVTVEDLILWSEGLND